MDDSTSKEKGFFKIFNPETSSKMLKIPASFTMYKNGKLPEKVALRDKYGNMWPIGLAKIERDLYFQEGWDKFIEENSVENGDFFIFDYDGNGVFDFKLLGRTGCQKRGAGGLKSAVKSEDEEEEEMNKHQKIEEPKVMNFDMDSDSIISASDSDEDYVVEEDDEEDEEYEVAEQETQDEATEEEEEEEATEEEEKATEEEEEENEKTVTLKRKAPPSKVAAIEKGLPEEEEEETEEEEEENERAVTLKRKAPPSKAKCKRVTAIEKGLPEEEEETEEEEENEKAVTLKRKAPPLKAKCKRVTAIQKDLPEEEETEEEEENENAERFIFKKRAPHSKVQVKNRLYENNDDEEENEEEEEENEKQVTLKRKASHSKDLANCKRAALLKRKDIHEEAEEDTEEEADENENAVLFKRRSLHSKAQVKKCLYGKNDEEEEYEEAEEEKGEEEEEEEETAEEEEEDEMEVILESKGPHSKAKCERAKETKKREFVDYYGADIFKSGRATQPKNPYFVARVHAKRKDMLYIPVDVLRDYNIELPSKMIIRDSSGRKFETEIKIWKDGRMWLSGGWGRLCRWNLVEKKDRCICEFVKGEGKRGLYIQVTVLH